MMPKVFLQADWKHLVLANYAVSDDLLIPYLPKSCELDRYLDSAYISLVAFQFLNTRVCGVRWPFHTNFSEINLRFYIRDQNHRGVCFIREFVPSAIVSTIARVLYNEPYSSAKMGDTVHRKGPILETQYNLATNDADLKIFVQAEDQPYLPNENSMEHWFKEHELGVGRNRIGEKISYEVNHPHWNIYPIQNYDISLNWQKIFGSKFEFLAKKKPDSIILAEGSQIKVHWKSNSHKK